METPEGKTPMKSKKRKGKKGKGKGKKGDGDDLQAFDMTTGDQFTTGSKFDTTAGLNETDAPLKGKKRKDKHKNKGDEVQELD